MGMKLKVDTPIPKTPRMFTIMDSRGTAVPHRENGEIVSLCVGNIVLKKGETVTIRKSSYKVNHIYSESSSGVIYYMFMVARLNKSSLFILPMLGHHVPVIGGNRRNFFFDSHLVNAFVALPGNDRCIALLYRFSGRKEFVEFEGFLNKIPEFIAQFDPNNDMAMYVFEIPPAFEKDYDLFLEGKYSRMSQLCKGTILTFHNFSNDGKLAEILYRSDKAKARLEVELDTILPEGAEVFDAPNMKEETFDPQVYT